MKIKSLIKLAKGFIDKRGKIIPICDQMMRSASLITTKKIIGELIIIISPTGIIVT